MESPVTHEAETAVKSASIKPIGPAAEETGSINMSVPSSIIAKYPIGKSLIGRMPRLKERLFFFAFMPVIIPEETINAICDLFC